MQTRVGVFVDVQNIYYSAKTVHHGKLNYRKLLDMIGRNRSLVKAVAYVITKPDSDQRSKRFEDALQRIGYEIRVKRAKVRRTEHGSIVRGACHVEMAVDMLAAAPKLDVAVLVSGDNELLPVVKHLQAIGCAVENVGIKKSTSRELIEHSKFIELPPELIIDMVAPEKEEESEEEEINGNLIEEDEPIEGSGMGIFSD